MNWTVSRFRSRESRFQLSRGYQSASVDMSIYIIYDVMTPFSITIARSLTTTYGAYMRLVKHIKLECTDLDPLKAFVLMTMPCFKICISIRAVYTPELV
jgi:hypothetical protein